VIAGELLPGEAVGVEIKLPLFSDPLRTRALVRHHDKLQAGMEFVGLSAEQQTIIRAWARTVKAEPVQAQSSVPIESVADDSHAGGSGGEPRPPRNRHARLWAFSVLSVVILLATLWWRWDRGWEDLESNLRHSKSSQSQRAQVHVPADVMQKMVTHRVDPDYPAAARPAKLAGVIVLEVVVDRDGSVVDVHALNGPEVLSRAASDALRWWRFEPYRVEGKPVVVETTVAVEFKP
jgi:TonB family protein